MPRFNCVLSERVTTIIEAEDLEDAKKKLNRFVTGLNASDDLYTRSDHATTSAWASHKSRETKLSSFFCPASNKNKISACPNELSPHRNRHVHAHQ